HPATLTAVAGRVRQSVVDARRIQPMMNGGRPGEDDQYGAAQREPPRSAPRQVLGRYGRTRRDTQVRRAYVRPEITFAKGRVPGPIRPPAPGRVTTAPGSIRSPQASQLTVGVNRCPQALCSKTTGGPPSGVAYRSPHAVRASSTGMNASPASVSRYRSRGGWSL